MGDSTCLMHGFSYASAIPNESKQGNPMHVLGESISFGRFMTEPLSWERWSTFSSHNKYVEEAQSYAQPGSVAQKKAFFEAHYKRIAAQKAAALLEQQIAGEGGDLEKENVLDPQIGAGESVEEVRVHELTTGCSSGSVGIGGNELVIRQGKRDSVKNLDNFENQDTISGSDGSGTPQIEERPLLKNHVASEEDVSSGMSKKKSGVSSLKPSIQRKTWKLPPVASTPAKPITPQFKTVNSVIRSTRKSIMDSMEKKKSSPKPLRQLINSIPFREPDKVSISATKETAIEGPAPASRTPKNSRIPWRTPIKATTTNSGFKHGAATPLSENRRLVKTSVDSTALGSKTSGPKWHILSSVCTKSLTACRNKLQSPTISTPFVLRTEERAAKRKQKLEEKFNANEVQKVEHQKTLKEKAGNEIRKLSCGSCFKARPLPEFYKEREMSIINQMKEAPTVLGKPVSSKKKQGTVSMPPAPPFPSSLANNSGTPSNNLFKKSITANPSRILSSSSSSAFRGWSVDENRSLNIQH